jgi:hypothetical protein
MHSDKKALLVSISDWRRWPMRFIEAPVIYTRGYSTVSQDVRKDCAEWVAVLLLTLPRGSCPRVQSHCAIQRMRRGTLPQRRALTRRRMP